MAAFKDISSSELYEILNFLEFRDIILLSCCNADLYERIRNRSSLKTYRMNDFRPIEHNIPMFARVRALAMYLNDLPDRSFTVNDNWMTYVKEVQLFADKLAFPDGFRFNNTEKVRIVSALTSTYEEEMAVPSCIIFENLFNLDNLRELDINKCAMTETRLLFLFTHLQHAVNLEVLKIAAFFSGEYYGCTESIAPHLNFRTKNLHTVLLCHDISSMAYAYFVEMFKILADSSVFLSVFNDDDWSFPRSAHTPMLCDSSILRKCHTLCIDHGTEGHFVQDVLNIAHIPDYEGITLCVRCYEEQSLVCNVAKFCNLCVAETNIKKVNFFVAREAINAENSRLEENVNQHMSSLTENTNISVPFTITCLFDELFFNPHENEPVELCTMFDRLLCDYKDLLQNVKMLKLKVMCVVDCCVLDKNLSTEAAKQSIIDTITANQAELNAKITVEVSTDSSILDYDMFRPEINNV